MQVSWVLDEEILCSQATGKHTVTVAQQFHLVGIIMHLLVHIEQIALSLVHGVELVGRDRIVMVDFHPCGRAPRTHEELELWTVFLGCAGQRDDVALVTLYIEITKTEVAYYIVTAIPTAGIVVGIHRYTAMGEPEVAVGRENVLHHLVLVVA